MAHAQVVLGRQPDHDECVEQAHFFRLFRERLGENLPAQEILERCHQEVLPSTRLPYAIQFLGMELKHSGRLYSGFEKLPHYFSPFQAFVVRQAEEERQRLTMPVALLILEREAEYKAKEPSAAGLFVYQFETVAHNRLGYSDGLGAIAGDPIFGPAWAEYVEFVRRQGGTMDFADLVYLRSELHVKDTKRARPDYAPPVPALFGEREGRIAAASRGRDPLFLFAALQRQLNYPEVPRPRAKDDLASVVEALKVKLRELEQRLRIMESEARGTFDPTKFGKPEGFRDLPEE